MLLLHDIKLKYSKKYQIFRNMRHILYHGKEISETSLQMLKEGKLKERDFTRLAYSSFAGQPQSVEDTLILSGCTNREHVGMISGS